VNYFTARSDVEDHPIMELDQRELKFINSPVRRFFQKHYEFRVFKQFLKRNGIDLTNKVILDAGCGSGYSTELIAQELQPKELVAFDIMPEQIELARQRGLSANIFIGDATNIELPSDMFDGVFVFDILHHIPKWRIALTEISRVTKSCGVLLIEEPSNEALEEAERYFKIYHPREARFDWDEFAEGLEQAGYQVIEFKTIFIGHFRSYVCRKG
jgi:SAM-dependent methyltransferase